MSTGQDKVIIFLKKFLTQQHITTNFLDYLHNLIKENHRKVVPSSGVYTYPVIGTSTAVDTMSFLTPGETTPGDGNGPKLEADDGHGHILKLDDALRELVPVENILANRYHCGLKYNEVPQETEINVRTGIIKHSLLREEIGERDEPTVVSYYNTLLQFNVDSVCKSITQTGRTVRIWKKVPVSQASGSVYEDAIIAQQSLVLLHDGGANFLDVPNALKGYFANGQSLTLDRVPTAPITTTVISVGADDSGGSGFARISTVDDLTGYTVALNTFVVTGHNIITLSGTLGQGVNPSVNTADYETFLFGITITTEDIRLDEYYAYLGNYLGTGAGTSPTTFDWSDQVEIPLDVINNIASALVSLQAFKRYQIERNGTILRGGGQISYKSGSLEWGSALEIINPFRGVLSIAANTLGSITNNDILYTKVWERQQVTLNGTAAGEIWVDDTTDMNSGDTIIIGDSDSNQVTGIINGAPVGEKLIVWDGANPIDLSAFTSDKGAWVQRTNLILSKEVFNQGELRPDLLGNLDGQIMVIAIAHGGILIFRDGVLRLEDGDIGQISDLPSGYNWINTVKELQDSLVRPIDGGLALLAPKTYSVAAKLEFNKNYNWMGLGSDSKITASLADPIVEITFDTTTTGSYMKARLMGLNIENLGAGPAIKIDNAGATKGMEITIEDSRLSAASGNSIEVAHTVPGQWIRLNIIDSKTKIWQGSIVFEAVHTSDELNIKDVKFSPGNSITFGEAATNPAAVAELRDVMVDQVIALGTGTSKIINLQDCYSWQYHKKIDIVGGDKATFQVSAIIVDENDFENYQKATNGMVLRGGGQKDFLSGTFFWGAPLEIADPFYGISIIDTNSLAGLVQNSVLYTKLYRSHMVWADGNAGGEMTIKDVSDFTDNDLVLVGDQDSVIASGFVFGAPVGDVVKVDDGAGTPINLSAMTVAKGAWIRKVNLTLISGLINTGDLKPAENGDIDPQVMIVGIVDGDVLTLRNGEQITRRWIYEEMQTTNADLPADSQILLPVDTRNGGAPKSYRVGTGTIQVWINGVKENQRQLELQGSFTPTAYNSVTGRISVPDIVDLSRLVRYDTFKDASGAEFFILGGIDDTPGNKHFDMATGQVVDLTVGATLYREGFREFGAGGTFQDRIVAKRPIPKNTDIIIRVTPLELAAGSGGGGGGGTLQSAYNGGTTIAILSGNPIVITGPAGQKLFRVLGDIEVTGVIDPSAISFSRQPSNPLPSAQDGLWIDNAGQLNHYNKDTESSAPISTGESSLKPYVNPNITTMLKGSMVRILSPGQMVNADYGTEENSRGIGILLEDTVQAASKNVRRFGAVVPGIITAGNFVEANLPPDNARIWLHANGKLTVSPPPKGSGKSQTVVGIWDQGGLILQIFFLGVA